MRTKRRSLKGSVLAVVGVAVLIAAVAGVVQVGEASTQERGIRVGTYDNRAIAVAYAAWEFNDLSEMMEEHKQAKASGDTERVKELEAFGKKQQRQLHRQGFGRVPVDDLLAHVEDKFPEVARKTGVDVIAWDCDYAAAHVEVIDITRELVMLFAPSEKTLKTAEEIRKHPFIDLDDLDEIE